MILAGMLCMFALMITGFIVIIDMFKKRLP